MATLPPYTEPGVTVEQLFEEALPALGLFNLPNVVVGPAFNVVFDDEVGTYTGAAADYSYVNQPVGTRVDDRPASGELDEYPVAINLKNAIAQLQQASTGIINASDLNTLNDPTSAIFANVLAGDIIVIASGPNAGQYTVRSKTDANNLKINETFPAAENPVSYTVLRNLGTVSFPVDTVGVTISELLVHLPAAFAVAVTPYVGTKPITQAEVHLSYRALRVDKSADVFAYANPGGVASLQADFGLDQIVPENPVVFGAFLALSQVTPEVNLLALPMDYLDTGGGSGDELVAYNKALDVLALTDMYAISVLTQNPAVHTALRSHVDLYSQAANKKERVGIINRKLITTSVVVDEATTDVAEGLVTAYPSGNVLFNYADGAFITAGVVPGMFLNITAPSGAAGRFEILAVNSQTQLQIAYTGVLAPPVNAVTFFIDKDLQKNDQADTMAAYAASIGDRRMVMTWPDQAKIPAGNVIRTLPGYYWNVAVGALVTGLPTQQGFTRQTVAVYSGVVHSTKYFTELQLNKVAAGGVMIFVQDKLDVTAPMIRHQLTTDRSSIKFQELSLTKNIDFVAKFLRINYNPFIGKYNIVDATLDDLKTFAARNIKFLKDQTIQPRIGGVIRNGQLIAIGEDTVNIDQVFEDFKMDFPIPLNGIKIRIFA